VLRKGNSGSRTCAGGFRNGKPDMEKKEGNLESAFDQGIDIKKVFL